MKEDCSITAVRKVIANIKRKLGDVSLSTSAMLHQLHPLGVLTACAHTLNL